MRFSCDKNVILKEITWANEIKPSRNTLSVLSSVLLNAKDNTLIIRATDLRVSFETRIPIYLESPGTATIFCDKFLGILKNFPDGDVFITKESENITITNRKNIKFQLHSISAENFPEIPDFEENNFFSLSQKDFVYMIGQTIFAMSNDETRYFMNGVYMESDGNRLVMVATDGRRLSHVYVAPEGGIPDFSGIIIPSKVLNLVAKLASGQGDIKLAVTDKILFVRFDRQKLTSTLIDGQFPNYSRVIPEDQNLRFTVNRVEFNDALRRVSLLADQKARRILLSLSEEGIVLKSDESEIGEAEEKIDCRYDGPGMDFALNYSYLLDPLKVIEQEDITVKFTDSHKAITIVSLDEPKFFHIIMPMQMEEKKQLSGSTLPA